MCVCVYCVPIAEVGNRESRYEAAAGVETYCAEKKEVSKGTREVHSDIAEQRHFMATLERHNEHQSSGQSLGLRTTKVKNKTLPCNNKQK